MHTHNIHTLAPHIIYIHPPRFQLVHWQTNPGWADYAELRHNTLLASLESRWQRCLGLETFACDDVGFNARLRVSRGEGGWLWAMIRVCLKIGRPPKWRNGFLFGFAWKHQPKRAFLGRFARGAQNSFWDPSHKASFPAFHGKPRRGM